MLNKFMTRISNVWSDNSGATAIEYGLIAGLVAVAIIAALTLLGTDLAALFAQVTNAI